MGKGYNNYMCKKPFHPGSKANIKRAWMAEQKTENEKRKQEELKTQYEKEQDLYNNRALISSESKDKLELNFMYEAPPGAKRERQKEDDEPEYKFEWQRKYNAPREDYARGNEDIKDQPFGIPVRNVRCIKCHKWGHINTDRECPLFMQASASSMPSTSMDPMELMRQMREDGYGLKENVLGHHVNPQAANQQLIPSDESDPETEFLKSLSTAEKKKLLRKLKKLSKKQEKSKKKKSKKSKKSKSKDWSESGLISESEEDSKQKRKKTKHQKSSSSSSDTSSEKSVEEISSRKRKEQNTSPTRDKEKRISKSEPARKIEKHSSVSDTSKKHSRDEDKKTSKEKLLKKSDKHSSNSDTKKCDKHSSNSDAKKSDRHSSNSDAKKSDKHSSNSDASKKHFKYELPAEKQTINSEKPLSDTSKKQKLVHDKKQILENSNRSHAEKEVTNTEKATEDRTKKTKREELPSSDKHLVHASSSKEFTTLSNKSDVIQSNWKSSYSSSSSESEEVTKTDKTFLEIGKATKRKAVESSSYYEISKKVKVEKADSDIKSQSAVNSKPEHPDGFSHVCPQAKIDSNYLLASEEYKGKMDDKFRNLYREDRSPSVKQKYTK